MFPYCETNNIECDIFPNYFVLCQTCTNPGLSSIDMTSATRCLIFKFSNELMYSLTDVKIRPLILYKLKYIQLHYYLHLDTFMFKMVKQSSHKTVIIVIFDAASFAGLKTLKTAWH